MTATLDLHQHEKLSRHTRHSLGVFKKPISRPDCLAKQVIDIRIHRNGRKEPRSNDHRPDPPRRPRQRFHLLGNPRPMRPTTTATLPSSAPRRCILGLSCLFLLVRKSIRRDFCNTRDDLRGERFERAWFPSGAKEDGEVCEEEGPWDLRKGIRVCGKGGWRGRTVIPSWVIADMVSALESGSSSTSCL